MTNVAAPYSAQSTPPLPGHPHLSAHFIYCSGFPIRLDSDRKLFGGRPRGSLGTGQDGMYPYGNFRPLDCVTSVCPKPPARAVGSS